MITGKLQEKKGRKALEGKGSYSTQKEQEESYNRIYLSICKINIYRLLEG